MNKQTKTSAKLKDADLLLLIETLRKVGQRYIYRSIIFFICLLTTNVIALNYFVSKNTLDSDKSVMLLLFNLFLAFFIMKIGNILKFLPFVSLVSVVGYVYFKSGFTKQLTQDDWITVNLFHIIPLAYCSLMLWVEGIITKRNPEKLIPAEYQNHKIIKKLNANEAIRLNKVKKNLWRLNFVMYSIIALFFIFASIYEKINPSPPSPEENIPLSSTFQIKSEIVTDFPYMIETYVPSQSPDHIVDGEISSKFLSNYCYKPTIYASIENMPTIYENANTVVASSNKILFNKDGYAQNASLQNMNEIKYIVCAYRNDKLIDGEQTCGNDKYKYSSYQIRLYELSSAKLVGEKELIAKSCPIINPLGGDKFLNSFTAREQYRAISEFIKN